MTALQFVGMLQRFIASRGAPSLIKGDNAKTFLATARHLKKITAKEPLEPFLIKNRVKWGFITPKAPWQGGFYERLIGVTENTLYKSMGCSKMRFRELETMMIQIEGVLYNRPLVYQAEDQEDEVITPNYLIYGQSLPIIGNSDEDNEEDVIFDKRLRYVQAKKAHLWKQWLKEYILSLQEYHRSSTKIIEPPRLGRLVLVVDSSSRQCYWQTGKVVEHLRGKDDVVRAVKIQVFSQG